MFIQVTDHLYDFCTFLEFASYGDGPLTTTLASFIELELLRSMVGFFACGDALAVSVLGNIIQQYEIVGLSGLPTTT
jgi:hypothetical protein